jgi:hypothetical protein
MTFYSSFWEAINALPKKDQLPVMRATIEYGLNGAHSEKLSVSQSAFFSLIKPNLDASRKKASSGKAGGSKAKANDKQTASKTEANGKQTASEKENENEIEKEYEIEVEIEKESLISSTATAAEDIKTAAATPAGFDIFWEKYPNKVCVRDALDAWKDICITEGTAALILSGLDRWNNSLEWEKEGGRYIPRPAKRLSELRWQEHPKEKVPMGASGQLGTAEMEAIQRLLKEES